MTVNLEHGYTRLILSECAHQGVHAIPYKAYILATAYWESARTMEPVRETLADSDEKAIRRLNKHFAGKDKRDYWSGGYFGRGFVQLTHEGNYEKASNFLGVDLKNAPEKALLPDIAATVLVRGMVEGWFTNYKLSDFVNEAGLLDYVGARKVVNGTDRAARIAELAVEYERALLADDTSHQIKAKRPKARPVEEAKPEPAAAEPTPVEAPAPTPAAPTGPVIPQWVYGVAARNLLRIIGGSGLGGAAVAALLNDPNNLPGLESGLELALASAGGGLILLAKYVYGKAKKYGWAT